MHHVGQPGALPRIPCLNSLEWRRVVPENSWMLGQAGGDCAGLHVHHARPSSHLPRQHSQLSQPASSLGLEEGSWVSTAVDVREVSFMHHMRLSFVI